MTRSRKLTLIAVLFTSTLAACIPISIPGLRNVHGQTWAARFDVEVRPGNVTTIRLPVDLALTFTQSLNDVTAEATLQYDTGLFTLQTGGLVNMQGRLGLDDHLSLQSSSNALARKSVV